MTKILNTQKSLDYSIQQIFAESYWNNYFKAKDRGVIGNDLKTVFLKALTDGNTREPDPEKQTNYTKLTDTLAAEAYNRYEIIDHIDNDPILANDGTTVLKRGTNGSGFSAILLKDKQTNEYTLAFRSTEYKEDFYRDALGADSEINDYGYAFSQMIEMEKYYQELISTGKISATTQLNISGYSLGANLAYNFYLLHPDNVKEAYTFNGPGVGQFIGVTKDLENYSINAQNLVNSYNDFGNMLNTLFNNLSINLTVSEKKTVIKNLQINQSNGKIVSILANSDPLKAVSLEIINKIGNYSNYLDKNDNTLLRNTLLSQVNGISLLNLNDGIKSIYEDSTYNWAIKFLSKEYNIKSINSLKRHIKGFLGYDSGSPEENIFTSNIFTSISGNAVANNYSNASLPDSAMVSQSGIHSNYNNVFIQSQPKLENFGGKIPLSNLHSKTKYENGDFGNSHSLTLLIDSLSTMNMLEHLSPGITQSSMEYLIKASSNEKAEIVHMGLVDKNESIEANSLNKLVYGIYKNLINKNSILDLFGRNPQDLGDVGLRDIIQSREKEIINYVEGKNINLNILDIGEKTFLGYGSFSKEKEVRTDILNKVNLNAASYKYAIRELNHYIINGISYEEMPIHSKSWYEARTNLLINKIEQNLMNYKDKYEIPGTMIIDKVAPIGYRQGVAQTEYFSIQALKTLYFGSDTAPINSSIFTYTDKKFDDKLFLGNEYNKVTITGGNDVIETGKGSNEIHINGNGVVKYNLYGNTQITRNNDYLYKGELYILDQKLSGGSWSQTENAFIDTINSNIKYTYSNQYKQLTILVSPSAQYQAAITTTFNNIEVYQLKFLGLNFNYGTEGKVAVNIPNDSANSLVGETDLITMNSKEGFITNNESQSIYSTQSGPVLGTINTPNNWNDPEIPDIYDFALGAIYIDGGGSVPLKNYTYVAGDKIIMHKNMHLEGAYLRLEGNDLVTYTYKNGQEYIHATIINGKDAVLAGAVKMKKNEQESLLLQDIENKYQPYISSSASESITTDSQKVIIVGNGDDYVQAGSGETEIYFRNTREYSTQSADTGTGKTRFIFETGDITNGEPSLYQYLDGANTVIINSIKAGDEIVFFDREASTYSLGGNSVGSETNGYHPVGGMKILNMSRIKYDLVMTSPPDYYNAKPYTVVIKDYYKVFPNGEGETIKVWNKYGPMLSWINDPSNPDYPYYSLKAPAANLTDYANMQGESEIVASNSTQHIANFESANFELVLNKNGMSINSLQIKEGTSQKVVFNSTDNNANIINLNIDGENHINNQSLFEIDNFKASRDKLNLSVPDIELVDYIRADNDLLIYVSEKNIMNTAVIHKSTIKLNGYFLDSNYLSIDLVRNSEPDYNSSINKSMNFSDIENTLNTHKYNSFSGNQTKLDVSSSLVNTDITVLNNNFTVIGSQHSDKVSLMNVQNSTMSLSSGIDTYNVGNGQHVFKNWNNLIIGRDASIINLNNYSLANTRFVYDETAKTLAIVSATNSITFNEIEPENLLYLPQVLKIVIEGKELFTNSTPFDLINPIEDSNAVTQIHIGDSVENSFIMTNSLSNIIFAKEGMDTIVANFQKIVEDSKINLIFAGAGDDTIKVGNNDIVYFRKGEAGIDTVEFSDFNNFKINLLTDSTQGEVIKFTKNNNDLRISLGNSHMNDMIVKDYWLLESDIDFVITTQDGSSVKNREIKLENVIDKNNPFVSADFNIDSLFGSNFINSGKMLGGNVAYNYLFKGDDYDISQNISVAQATVDSLDIDAWQTFTVDSSNSYTNNAADKLYLTSINGYFINNKQHLNHIIYEDKSSNITANFYSNLNKDNLIFLGAEHSNGYAMHNLSVGTNDHVFVREGTMGQVNINMKSGATFDVNLLDVFNKVDYYFLSNSGNDLFVYMGNTSIRLKDYWTSGAQVTLNESKQTMSTVTTHSTNLDSYLNTIGFTQSSSILYQPANMLFGGQGVTNSLIGGSISYDFMLNGNITITDMDKVESLLSDVGSPNNTDISAVVQRPLDHTTDRFTFGTNGYDRFAVVNVDNRLVWGNDGDDILTGNYSNYKSKPNLLVPGEGNDTIMVGYSDVVVLRSLKGESNVKSIINAANYYNLNFVQDNNDNISYKFSISGNHLVIEQSFAGKEDKVILNNFATSNPFINVYVSKVYNNGTEEVVENNYLYLNGFLSNSGLTANNPITINSNDLFTYTNFQPDTLIGGGLMRDYIKTGDFNNLNVGLANNILMDLNTSLFSDIDNYTPGTTNPTLTDYRTNKIQIGNPIDNNLYTDNSGSNLVVARSGNDLIYAQNGYMDLLFGGSGDNVFNVDNNDLIMARDSETGHNTINSQNNSDSYKINMLSSGLLQGKMGFESTGNDLKILLNESGTNSYTIKDYWVKNLDIDIVQSNDKSGTSMVDIENYSIDLNSILSNHNITQQSAYTELLKTDIFVNSLLTDKNNVLLGGSITMSYLFNGEQSGYSVTTTNTNLTQLAANPWSSVFNYTASKPTDPYIS